MEELRGWWLRNGTLTTRSEILPGHRTAAGSHTAGTATWHASAEISIAASSPGLPPARSAASYSTRPAIRLRRLPHGRPIRGAFFTLWKQGWRCSRLSSRRRRRRIMRVFAADLTIARDARSFAFIPRPFGGFTKPVVATMTGQIVARGPKNPLTTTQSGATGTRHYGLAHARRSMSEDVPCK
jgi:hypothetical protein